MWRFRRSIILIAVVSLSFLVQNLLGIPTRSIAVNPDQPYILSSYLISVISHESMMHFIPNVIMLIVLSLYIESRNRNPSIYIVFFASGIVASISYIFICELSVCGYGLGSSGGIMGFLGYVISINLSDTAKYLLFICLASLLWISISLSSIGISRSVHLVGLCIGIAIGIHDGKK